MTSSSDSDYSDLVQSVQSDREVQEVVQHLNRYFSFDSIPKKDGCSEVKCSDDASGPLEKVREKFLKQYVAKKINDIVKKIVGRPSKVHYISQKVSLFVFQSGWSELANIQGIEGKDNCYILIPVATTGSVEATVKERLIERRTEIKFEINSELIISGRGSLWLPPQSKVVCVVLGIKKD